jgi:uncharacterized tellurite resistance protein B-like protein
MPEKDLLLTLAKIVIAAAWTDGKITSGEMACLKDLLYRLPHAGLATAVPITADEWTMLEMYIESPISPDEHQRLLAELAAHLHKADDKKLVLDALASLIGADGAMTDEELNLAEDVEEAITAVDVSLMTRMGRLVRKAINRRATTLVEAPNREQQFEDYVQNRVFYAVRQRLNLVEGDLGIAEADLRKLSLAGGLMAQVAHVDRVVTPEEFTTMVQALQGYWGVDRQTAVFIAEVAVSKITTDLDYYRMTRQFFANTTAQEREQFLNVLLAIAAADSGISHEESENIRRIAVSLNLSRQQFMTAKGKFA